MMDSQLLPGWETIALTTELSLLLMIVIIHALHPVFNVLLWLFNADKANYKRACDDDTDDDYDDDDDDDDVCVLVAL